MVDYIVYCSHISRVMCDHAGSEKRDTLSGFMSFFRQPIIKERSKIKRMSVYYNERMLGTMVHNVYYIGDAGG